MNGGAEFSSMFITLWTAGKDDNLLMFLAWLLWCFFPAAAPLRGVFLELQAMESASRDIQNYLILKIKIISRKRRTSSQTLTYTVRILSVQVFLT